MNVGAKYIFLVLNSVLVYKDVCGSEELQQLSTLTFYTIFQGEFLSLTPTLAPTLQKTTPPHRGDSKWKDLLYRSFIKSVKSEIIILSYIYLVE
jgi:hypothetical protein